MKIAIVHEMLIKLGGAEKVVEKLIKMYPTADIYTPLYDEKKVGKIFPKEKVFTAPFTQYLYNITGKQRLCLPFLAKAIESFNLSKYDVVIVSSSGFAHGVITKPETKTIVYYHSPMRYIWDWTNEYKEDIGWDKGIKGFFLNSFFKKLRIWDVLASKRHDITLANSNNVAQRIEKYYRKKSEVVYPPIEIKRFQKEIQDEKKSEFLSSFGGEEKGYYIIVSALTEFKKIDTAIENMKQTKNTLLIVGEGSYKKVLEEKKGDATNIIFLGAKYGDELVMLVQNAKGLIFPGEEDFGIVPIEALGSGVPVFAYRGGGLAETIEEDVTGNFFTQKDGSDFQEKFKLFEKNIDSGVFKKEDLEKKAEMYSEEKFEEKIRNLIL